MIYYKNDQWKVTDVGLEAIGRANYWLDKGTLVTIHQPDDDLLHLPFHMIGKRWVNMQLFMDAFYMALLVHHLGNQHLLKLRKDWIAETRRRLENHMSGDLC